MPSKASSEVVYSSVELPEMVFRIGWWSVVTGSVGVWQGLNGGSVGVRLVEIGSETGLIRCEGMDWKGIGWGEDWDG